MTTVTAPTPLSTTLTATQIATFAAAAGFSGLIQMSISGAIVDQTYIGSGQTVRFGPYGADVDVYVRPDNGVLTYTAATSASATNPTVAGVAPDSSFDVPAASLKTALGQILTVGGITGDTSITAAELNAALATVLTVAGLSPSGAGAITAANLRTALGLPFTVAGVAASGWAGDVAVASLRTALACVLTVAGVSPTAGAVAAAALAQALAADRTMTWAQHITAGAGTYDGQLRRISVTAGGPNQVFTMEWNAAEGAWGPQNGRQLVHVGGIVTDTNSSGTQSVTGTAWTAPAAFFREPDPDGFGAIGLEVEISAETSISATARTVSLQLDATVTFAGPLAATANRRVAARGWGFLPTDATHGFSLSKPDANEYDYAGGANSNLVAVDRTWANAIAIAANATFTTAASAATATMRRYKCYMVRG